uniref:E4 protein n=1 Tax=Human papillomavirus TaxID=10566 RepID=A0A385PL55_9PAPI|nr:MAG: E4 protein [Human papillomavirus]
MLRDMDKLNSGQLSLKIKLCLPPCLVPQGLFPNLPTKPSNPPLTPRPPRRSLERDIEKPRRTPTPNRPHQPSADFDDDEENQENQPPEDDEGPIPTLHHLLKKWERDLDRFREQVYQDLEGFKRKLGIRH